MDARDFVFIEAAGNLNVSDIVGTTNVRRGLNEIRIDINRTLPDGSVNPMFLEPYGEMMEYRTGGKHDYSNLRFQAAYVKETRLGKFQLLARRGEGGSPKHGVCRRWQSI